MDRKTVGKHRIEKIGDSILIHKEENQELNIIIEKSKNDLSKTNLTVVNNEYKEIKGYGVVSYNDLLMRYQNAEIATNIWNSGNSNVSQFHF